MARTADVRRAGLLRAVAATGGTGARFMDRVHSERSESGNEKNGANGKRAGARLHFGKVAKHHDPNWFYATAVARDAVARSSKRHKKNLRGKQKTARLLRGSALPVAHQFLYH